MVKEKLMPLMTAVKEVLGHEIAYNTIWAWQKLGVSGVKLKAQRVENKLVTSVEAVRRFHSAVSKIKGNRMPRILQGLDQPEHEFPIEESTEEQATPTAAYETEKGSRRTLVEIKLPVSVSVFRVLIEAICNEHPKASCRQVGCHLVLEEFEG